MSTPSDIPPIQSNFNNNQPIKESTKIDKNPDESFLNQKKNQKKNDKKSKLMKKKTSVNNLKSKIDENKEGLGLNIDLKA
tara:strand:+ start:2621 stop:2860 length:240 start_codon:yes stop_codon:yes gene_type:complete